MPRVKRGVHAQKKRRKILKAAKGYRFARSKKEREARVAVLHAGVHAYRHRRTKKRDFRRLWQIQISAAVRPFNLSYSRFINLLKQKQIGLDRKSLSYLAREKPESFKRLVASITA